MKIQTDKEEQQQFQALRDLGSILRVKMSQEFYTEAV